MKSILKHLDKYAPGTIFFHPSAVWEILSTEGNTVFYKVIWLKNNDNLNSTIRTCDKTTVDWYVSKWKERPDR